jgi:dihydropteroate synthase
MKTKVMGIVNVTPDSFSDGGKYFHSDEAVARARHLVDEGADIIDLGGESTRPGAVPLAWETEWARLEPVLDGLFSTCGDVASGRVRVSVDTYHPETAARALDAGAAIINCVAAASVPAMLPLCAARQAELVLPASVADAPLWEAALAQRGRTPAGAAQAPFYLDPMIGFGTTREEDLALLRALPALAKKGRVLVGASRKRIVKKLTGEKVTGKNLGGNLGIAVWCALHGADVVRVHDVRETVQALRVLSALAGA